ncbi:MAG TPA: penicillin acylase family protein [Vicinamibacterales bacterium]|nr:penicillin acylase family protein [Vicinamibacterales bacterium]
MAGWKKRLAWGAISVAVIIIVAVVVGGVVVRQRLSNSLPVETGSLAVAGLGAPVTIDRDHLGVPTIVAGSRADAARVLGFVHAQDRFFQMDLQRRQAAGELSALVGARALEIDRASRLHRFRHISQQALAQTSPGYRAILDAYAAGVNAGLSALAAAPIEYLMLRVDPEPWKAEDTILTILTMFNTLQGRQPQFEATFGTLADTMPPAMYDFLTARGSEWDAPISGGTFARPSIPTADVFDLRKDLRGTEAQNRRNFIRDNSREFRAAAVPWLVRLSDDEAAGLGSNNWAVSGTHTATGAALVANDMHLAISVPNIWYRASMQMPDPRAPGQTLTLTGVTLPGLPSLIVGSNGHVAWGFTNTGGDWSDLVIIEPDPRRTDHYLTPSGPRAIEVFDEPISTTAGAEPFKAHWTIWGPIVRRDHQGRDLAQRWVAHDAAVLASDITAPETARTLDEVLAVAAGLGIPAQNFVAGDTTGRVGWTIAGAIPKRVGFDGSRPMSWADGSRRWDGYVTGDAFPRVVDPAAGRLWTANSPVVEGNMLATVGEGGYADGIRARVIRDRLMAIAKATPADMLSVQLDDSALFHERWRTLLLSTLNATAVQGHDQRAEFRRLVDTTWTGKAEPRSVAYRLVRTFRQAVFRDVFTAITSPAKRVDRDFDYGRANRAEGPLWQLITDRPAHLLHPRYQSWDAQLLASVDTSIAELETLGGPLADRTWGEFNRAIVTHPLGGALPVVHRWFNMPSDPLPGDVFTPRAHSPRAGPSERMVVSPGREHEGILHMPTGQSGHPWSPHYADQHRAWVDGTPLPFLPGPSVARLTLTP